jgi:hypothetical protein
VGKHFAQELWADLKLFLLEFQQDFKECNFLRGKSLCLETSYLGTTIRDFPLYQGWNVLRFLLL